MGKITKYSMHKTFTVRSLQLKWRSVCCHPPPRNSPSSHYRPRGQTRVKQVVCYILDNKYILYSNRRGGIAYNQNYGA